MPFSRTVKSSCHTAASTVICVSSRAPLNSSRKLRVRLLPWVLVAGSYRRFSSRGKVATATSVACSVQYRPCQLSENGPTSLPSSAEYTTWLGATKARYSGGMGNSCTTWSVGTPWAGLAGWV